MYTGFVTLLLIGHDNKICNKICDYLLALIQRQISRMSHIMYKQIAESRIIYHTKCHVSVIE